jgi:hypothetical protein
MMAPEGQIHRASARAAGRVRDRAKKGATVDKGLMRNSVVSEEQTADGPYRLVFRIGSKVFYAIYQELGTGPIYARRAPLLVFRTKGGRWVATYSTRGVPAVHFLGNAIAEVTAADFLP